MRNNVFHNHAFVYVCTVVTCTHVCMCVYTTQHAQKVIHRALVLVQVKYNHFLKTSCRGAQGFSLGCVCRGVHKREEAETE